MDATEPAGHGVAAEPDVVSTKTVVRFGILLAILSAVAMLSMAALFKFLERGADRRDAAETAEAGLGRREARLPPPPRLQVDGARHWQEFRSAEERRLATYGWMDRGSGAVHIPIEKAMEVVLDRGVAPLPPAPAPPAAAPAEGPR
ncbi:MAG TPA: hypothetical protein VIA29_08785 [Thermoanaerobaculia bacterium]|jgi:hypothetical protein